MRADDGDDGNGQQATATTPSGSAVPVRSIPSGPIDYRLQVTANDCPFGPSAGAAVTQRFRFDRTDGRPAAIGDGDTVRITFLPTGEVPQDIGESTFHFERFVFTYNVEANEFQGRATLVSTFAEDGSLAAAELLETYTTTAGSCEITAGT